jgi:hypothetical protein
VANTSQSTQGSTASRKDDRRTDQLEKEVICKLPDQIPPDQERGERLDTARTVATGGKNDTCSPSPSKPANGT